MAIEVLIAGAIAASLQPVFEEAKAKQNQANIEMKVATYSRVTGLAFPTDYSKANVWFKELTSEIDKCSAALKKLYDAIDIPPHNERYPTGISESDDGTGYWINFITELSFIPKKKQTGITNFMPLFYRVKDRLQEKRCMYHDLKFLEWYDKVVERVLFLLNVMVKAAGNWERLLYGKWPDRDFMHARNYMSWDEFLGLYE